MSSQRTTQVPGSWPTYWIEPEVARADAAVMTMVDEIEDHKQTCDPCQQHQTCPTMGEIIDRAHRITSSIGREAFARYLEQIENAYRPWTPKEKR